MSSARLYNPLLLAAVLLQAALVQAAPDATSAHHDLKHTSVTFLAAESGVAVTAYASSWFLIKPKTSCHWCTTNSFDDSIRSALRADEPRTAAFVSHALSVGAIPVLGLTGLLAPAGIDEQWHRGIEDAWILVNTFVITAAVGDTVKNLVARRRPAFAYQRQIDTEFRNYPNEANKSFFSLDTAWAFSLASASATLAYLRGYSTAPYIAVGGGLLAIGAGSLRIVGDAHWATDVITGAVVGTGIGVALPLLLHGRRDDAGATQGSGVTALTVAPSAVGNGVSLAFAF